MRHDTDQAGRRAIPRAALSLLAVALIGAAIVPARADDDEGTESFSDKMSNSISNSVGGIRRMFGNGKAPPPPPDASPSGCPDIAILDGTGAQRVMANEAAGNAGLRYQFSILDVGRECRVSGNQMTLKVGVSGRVLLGPSGAPGAFDVPIRVAIVDAVSDKPAVSRLFKVAASIPAGQSATPYTLVADSLVIPFAAGRVARDYTIKIGIDTAGKGDGGPKPARHHKPKPVATAR